MHEQLQLLTDACTPPSQVNHRYGTFTDNMRLPVHRWYRYSAGFSAEWAVSLLRESGLAQRNLVLDPFAGSGTALLAADQCQIPSVGIEAHPFVARIANAKLLWAADISEFSKKANAILRSARSDSVPIDTYPDLVRRCYSPSALQGLTSLKMAWRKHQNESPGCELTWLAITAILRATSSVGTAQWQYILPKKEKKIVLEPFEAFQGQVQMMQTDMAFLQRESARTMARMLRGDARGCPEVGSNSVDAVITSPPYANNYDYADATRLEMSFWGEVQSWGALHEAVRKHLIVSSSQHASVEGLTLEGILESDDVMPIRGELKEVCQRLAVERLSHGGKKHYHTMIAAYFADMARAWRELRRVCRVEALVCFVVGDSAPYGIHVPVYKWLGDLSVSAGFKPSGFEKLRDRNMKWKNRKHRVPLSEGILWMRG